MPKFTDDLEQHQMPVGHYGFSGAKIQDLESTEYTLVTIVLDESGSTQSFKDDMEKCISEIVKACKSSPRADNLLLRLVAFGSKMREVHGFQLLEKCPPDSYMGCYNPGGSTALFDATENAFQAMQIYADKLTKQDYSVNGIVFVLTDGEDNVSKSSTNQVAKAQENCVKQEAMESLVSVLIGVNVQNVVISNYLTDFQNDVSFTQYVELSNADSKTLAKLADFVSKSISSQSQALGTGGPSQSLTF